MLCLPLLILSIFGSINALAPRIRLNSSFTANEHLQPIASTVECKQDVEAFCERHRDSDWTTIECLQQDEKTLNAVSSECQHLIWKRKHLLTQKSVFESSIPNRCVQYFNFPECRSLADSSYYVPCLVEHKSSVNDPACKIYLNRVAAFIFSDYRLVYHLIDSCAEDIQQWQCGRLSVGPSSPAEELSHLSVKSQGATIHCLKIRIEKLKPQCQFQLFRITELQSDDYHLDRPLYYACREDREQLCGRVNAGDGMVYACLKDHKYDRRMSPMCRKMISERQLLRSVDYSVDFRLAKACATDLAKASQCNGTALSKSDSHLSQIMLCLEAIEKDPRLDSGNNHAVAKSHHLRPECSAQLIRLRRELLDDYRLSPDLLTHCHTTIEQHCSSQKHGRGTVLHCLLHRLRLYTTERPSKQCELALYNLTKLTNVPENLILDPVIDRACHSLLTGKCAESHKGDYDVLFECLSAHAQDPAMTSSCARHLGELNYFIIRDVLLDDQLHRACSEDSLKLCDAPHRKWSDPSNLDGHLLVCLYNHRRHRPETIESVRSSDVLSERCEVEVMRDMHLRASSLSLEPRVFEVCLTDLASCDEEEDEDEEDDEDDLDYLEDDADVQHAARARKKASSHQDRPKRLSGMNCLQQRLQDLRPECKKAVMEVSGEAQDDLNLDKLVSEACVPAETRFCPTHEIPERVLHCLIQHKNHPQMEEACRVAVEHMQLIAAKDIHLSPRFFRHCRPDVERYCKSQIAYGTSAVVVCLSAELTAARLFEIKRLSESDPNSKPSSPSVSPLTSACHHELVAQLYERSETIVLDPELAMACKADHQRFCAHVSPGDARVLNCLRDHRQDLTPDCHSRLFERDQLSVIEDLSDYPLLATCQDMIHLHCRSVITELSTLDNLEFDKQIGHHSIVQCLTTAMSHEATRVTFDSKCRRHIWSTLALRAKDYRLNPELIEGCGRDIAKFCLAEAERTRHEKYEQNGPVLRCLKKHFVELKDSNHMLSHECQVRIRLVIRWESAAYHLDPILTSVCKTDVIQHCAHRIPPGDNTQKLSDDELENMDRNVRECLQDTLRQGKLGSPDCAQEVVLMIEESKSDLHVDPVLRQACAVEVQQLCGEIEAGQGRQIACLLHILDSPKASSVLQPHCRNQLAKRRELWNYVAKLQGPDSLKQMIEQVRASPSKNNVLIALFIIVSIIFIFGLCCGRVTKRVPIDVKTR